MKSVMEREEIWEALDIERERRLGTLSTAEDLIELAQGLEFDESATRDYFQNLLEQEILDEEANDLVANFRKIAVINKRIVQNNMTEQECSLEQRILQRKLKKSKVEEFIRLEEIDSINERNQTKQQIKGIQRTSNLTLSPPRKLSTRTRRSGSRNIKQPLLDNTRSKSFSAAEYYCNIAYIMIY